MDMVLLVACSAKLKIKNMNTNDRSWSCQTNIKLQNTAGSHHPNTTLVPVLLIYFLQYETPGSNINIFEGKESYTRHVCRGCKIKNSNLELRGVKKEESSAVASGGTKWASPPPPPIIMEQKKY